MLIKPRPGFEFPLAVADTVNPYLVLLSIVGLFLEYTPLKVWVIPVNQVIDVLFVVDFVVRLACFPTGKYFFHGYGWVDFLASLPGITLLFSYTPMFATFKFLRIGRFFKVIRLLRFLRIFSFLKKMKDDSLWIQDKVMKIGITVVLVFVVGLFLVDTLGLGYLTDLKSRYYVQQYYGQGRDPAKVAAADRDVLFFTKD
ncbi:MAG TPA: ion transporter, partial [Spirochaetia bacterium]|nr:ion transporter [Spirochaetia bacterium]